jgi:5-(carboxyamino)imidazole ribonucleotide mutase
MGSASDRPVMQKAADVLAQLGIDSDVKVLSAHRTPDALSAYLRSLEERGIAVVIAGAGGAAHLAGAVAAQTTVPVIGVPLASSSLNGLDALLSTVQMPRGVPVATVAIGEAGAANAGLLAAQILGVADEAVRAKVKAERKAQAQKVLESDQR